MKLKIPHVLTTPACEDSLYLTPCRTAHTTAVEAGVSARDPTSPCSTVLRDRLPGLPRLDDVPLVLRCQRHQKQANSENALID